MKEVFIGIDPGKTGAIAVITGSKLRVYDTPTVVVKNGKKNTTQFELPALWQTLLKIKKKAGKRQVHAVIEKVQAQPMFGAIPNFGLGNSFGHWEMALVAAGISFEYVIPDRWKKDLGIPSKSDKTASRLLAQKLYPTYMEYFKRVKDDGRADATLMANWLKRQHKG